MSICRRAALTVLLVLVSSGLARADLIFGASGVSGADGPVNATVNFTLGNGTVHIVVTDLLANPTSSGQTVSGIDFKISDATNTCSLTSATGLISTIDTSKASGSYTAGVMHSIASATDSAPWSRLVNSPP